MLSNKNVNKCSTTSITYRKKFKVWAVKVYFENGLSPNMIFEEAGFDLIIIGKDKPDECLRRWRKSYQAKGELGLLKESRGGPGRRKKIKFQTKDEEIKYLKTKIKYFIYRTGYSSY